MQNWLDNQYHAARRADPPSMAFGVSRLVHGVRPPEYLDIVGRKKVASDRHNFALGLALWSYNLALCQSNVHAPTRDEPAVQCRLSLDG
jgi:hypothetical protein